MGAKELGTMAKHPGKDVHDVGVRSFPGSHYPWIPPLYHSSYTAVSTCEVQTNQPTIDSFRMKSFQQSSVQYSSFVMQPNRNENHWVHY